MNICIYIYIETKERIIKLLQNALLFSMHQDIFIQRELKFSEDSLNSLELIDINIKYTI